MTDNISGYRSVLRTLRQRLAEPSPTKLQLLVGPRQVGKTTLLLELARESEASTLYVNADTPEAILPGWADAQWRVAEEKAAVEPTVLLIDEIQALLR